MPKRIMEGVVVVRQGQNKTAIVRVERTFTHPLMKKIVRRSKKYHAHDADNDAVEGQIVTHSRVHAEVQAEALGSRTGARG